MLLNTAVARQMVNCWEQADARFQADQTLKRDLAIWHKLRPRGPSQRFAGAEPVYRDRLRFGNLGCNHQDFYIAISLQ
jgi:hypothetical protein